MDNLNDAEKATLNEYLRHKTIEDLLQQIRQLEEENSCLRSVILAINERLAVMVDMADTTFNELIKHIEVG
jgi:hypothetical protein